jgi:hypothetical protein
LFQAVGFIGIVILTRTVAHVQHEYDLSYTKLSLLIFFLPSMYFWTCAIGKDAPLFFASSLAAWAMLKLSSRWIWFALAILVMVAFRPHIAMVATISLMLSLFLDRRYDIVPRMIFIGIALVSCTFLLSAVGNTYRFNATDANSVADFFASQSNMSILAPGSTTVEGNFVTRLLSLLFRPMFFDAIGLFGLISSVENLLFVAGFAYIIMNFRGLIRWFGTGLFPKYCFFFTVILTMLLAQVYYNVGLGLRQRVMIYPTLLPILVAAWAIARARRQARELASATHAAPA